MGLPRRAGVKSVLLLLCYWLAPAAKAQFKEIGPPPFSQAAAQQKIRGLLSNVDPSNRRQTLDSLNALTPWFRNILDEELISAWQSEKRDRLTLVLEPLADTRVATAVVEFSWRKRTESTFNPGYATILGQLMARYPESGQPFLSDLMASAPPQLSPQEAETVCRILIDMPDIGTWHRSALEILPHYRSTAEQLLRRDRQEDDQEKSYRAQRWLAELHGDTPDFTSQASVGHKRPAAVSRTPSNGGGPILFPPPSAPPQATVERGPDQAAGNGPRPLSSAASPPARIQAPPAVAPAPIQPTPDAGPRAAPLPVAPAPYTGAMSGTLECTGSPIPQNAEYVFRNLPPLKLHIDYDQKVWEARLSPGENQTQRLILRNKSSGPQKRCEVHWSIVPGQ
ncbi:MAG TPA: hypothetical protein VLY24_00065 [Bryobacteraceae bacterium]|nr:hypothetical protein [Bryobacteraceae bacterium]